MKAVSYKRVLAYIFDILIITLISSLLTMFIPVSEEYQEKANELNDVMEQYTNEEITEAEYLEKVNDISYVVSKESIATSIVSVVITTIYFVVVAYYMNGQTFGKKLMKLQVVSIENKKATMNQLLIRSLLVDSIFMNMFSIVTILFMSKSMYLQTYDISTTIFGAIYVVIFAMILFREDGRGLHDILAKTKVVSVNENGLNESTINTKEKMAEEEIEEAKIEKEIVNNKNQGKKSNKK